LVGGNPSKATGRPIQDGGLMRMSLEEKDKWDKDYAAMGSVTS